MSIDFASVTKSSWISLSEDYYKNLLHSLHQISPQEWKKTSPYFGWHGYEVLAHMASSNTINFQFLIDLALNDRPVPEPPFDFFLRNAKAVENRKRNSVEQVLEEFRSTLETNMVCYKNMSEDEWLKPAWFFIGDVKIRTLFLVQLSDILVHERDILFPSGKWKGYDSNIFELLVDWFMCEFRPASFRKDSADNLEISVLYHLNGEGGGDWTMFIKDGECYTKQGNYPNPDVTVEADTGDLVVVSLARANPIVGLFFRMLDFLVNKNKREDFVAFVTGNYAFWSAVLGRRFKITGNRSKIMKLKKVFWHFWDRKEQSEANIAASILKN